MLTDEDIRKKITQLRKSEGKIYAPLKYFRVKFGKNVETRYKKDVKKTTHLLKLIKRLKRERGTYIKVS